MTVKIDGTNTEANPAFTGADTDTGLQCGTDELKLVTGGTARATVDSSGNVGIGTESPSNELHIHDPGEGSVDARIQLTNGDTGTAGSDGLLIIQNGSTLGYQANFLLRENGPMGFFTNNTERMRILSSGGLTFNGDTAQANALDDYEQGTWDPTVAFGGSSSGIGYNEQQGIYVKIGNLVWASMVLSFNNNGSGSGAITISLPFAVGDNSENRASGTLSYFANFSGLNSNPNVYAPSGGSTTCRLQHLNNSSGSGTQVTTLTDSNVTNSASWRAAVMYTTID